MPSIYAFLTTASLPLIALSAPTTKRAGFSVPRIATGHSNNAAVANYRTFQKYDVEAPADVKKAADDASGSVTATPQPYLSEFLCPVTVGKNQLNLDFDTGSSDLWVFSTLTPSSLSSGHNLYDISTGTEIPGETWNISYVDKSGSSGVVYADTVVVGGATVTSQAVEVATAVSSQFVSGASDGLLGLGYDNGNTCSPRKCQTFFGNLMNSTASPLFTADLQPNGGSYDFGYIDNSKYSGSITYVDILKQGSHWDFTAGESSFGSSSGGSVGYSIMDTGTSLWYLPEDIVSAFYDSLGGSYNSVISLYVYSCSITPPDVSVVIGGTTFTVPGSALNYEPVGDGTCVGGIQYGGQTLPASIFGDVFMKNFFVVFNQGTDQLGIATQ